MQATGWDLAAQHQAIGGLKSWVLGFSKNRPGPYLDSEISRLVLFPRALRSAVIGYIPSKSEPRTTEGSVAGEFLAESPISAEEEEDLLNPQDQVVDSSAAPVPQNLDATTFSGGVPGLPVAHSSPQGKMEVELMPALAPPASVQSPTDESASSSLFKVLGISREEINLWSPGLPLRGAYLICSKWRIVCQPLRSIHGDLRNSRSFQRTASFTLRRKQLTILKILSFSRPLLASLCAIGDSIPMQ